MTTHPDESRWMHFLYDECDPDDVRELQRHLADCAECAARVTQWKKTLVALDGWHSENLSVPQPTASRTGRARRSALATMLSLAVVVLAFAAGRSAGTRPGVDAARLKSELSAQLRQELVSSLRAELTDVVTAEVRRNKPDRTELLPLIETESDRVVSTTLAKWARSNSGEAQKLQQVLAGILANQVALRTDLENLAIEAEAQILRTRRELLRYSAAPDSLKLPSDDSDQPTPDAREF